MARICENREALLGKWLCRVDCLWRWNQERSIRKLEIQQRQAAGLMLEPSDSIAVPPLRPVMPPNIFPRAAGVRSFVRGGSIRLAVQAVRDCPAATPFT